MMHKSEIHKKFDYVFTSNENLVDNKNFLYKLCNDNFKKNKENYLKKNFSLALLLQIDLCFILHLIMKKLNL